MSPNFQHSGTHNLQSREKLEKLNDVVRLRIPQVPKIEEADKTQEETEDVEGLRFEHVEWSWRARNLDNVVSPSRADEEQYRP